MSTDQPEEVHFCRMTLMPIWLCRWRLLRFVEGFIARRRFHADQGINIFAHLKVLERLSLTCR